MQNPHANDAVLLPDKVRSRKLSLYSYEIKTNKALTLDEYTFESSSYDFLVQTKYWQAWDLLGLLEMKFPGDVIEYQPSQMTR